MATTKKAPRRGTVVDRSGPFATIGGKAIKGERVTRPRTRRRQAPRAPKLQMHVAVVVRKLAYSNAEPVTVAGVWSSQRGRGDWAAFLGVDQDSVIAEAMSATKAWGPQYEVWVGTLTGLVQMPKPRFEVVSL